MAKVSTGKFWEDRDNFTKTMNVNSNLFKQKNKKEKQKNKKKKKSLKRKHNNQTINLVPENFLTITLLTLIPKYNN